MDFVTPWLAVGALQEAADAGLRRRHGIDAVLSLLPVDFDAGASHLTLAIADRIALPGATIRAATAFLEKQRQAGRKTLLHCQMGISRSPALAACYLHEYGKHSLAEAISSVIKARPLANPHPALLASMARHYATPAPKPSIIDLSANENPLGPSPLALAALQAALPTAHRYPDRHGDRLRQALASKHRGKPEQIVLGNGSCEILDLAARAFLAPGDSAIIVPPCFPAYRSAVRRAHGQLIEVPLVATEDFAYRLERITAAIDERTRLIFLGNPNNPTGGGVGASALTDWLDTLPEHIVVLLDEAYRDYIDEQGATTGPAMLADGPALVTSSQRLLVVRSFSKLHGLAGLRLGYAFGPVALTEKLEALRPTYNTNAPAQAAALAALADEAHQAASRQQATAGRNALVAGLSALGISCSPALGNFVLARFDDAGLDAAAIAAALAEAGILVKPGAAFGLPGYLRISVGLSEEQQTLLDQLQRLTGAAAQQKHHTTQ